MSKNITNCHIGRKIILRRKFLDLTQQDLATMSGIDLRQLVRYETGIDHPDTKSLSTIAKALNVEVEYFHIN